MTAFRNTARLPVDQVEFDVHRTRDDQLVVHHDATLDRMTDGSGPIAALTYAELSAFTINGTDGEPIPLLSQVLALFQPTSLGLRLEIKPDADGRPYVGLEAAVGKALVDHDLLARTVVTSFLVEILEGFRAVQPSVPLIWLVNRIVFRHIGGIGPTIGLARGRGFAEIALHVDNLTAAAMKAADDAGIALGAYGAHDEAALRRMFDLGVSAMTSDRPDLALKVRAEHMAGD